MVLRRSHYDGVHIDARETDQAGVQGSVLHNGLYLDNDFTAGVFHSLGDGQGLCSDTLPLEGAVAAGIGIGGPDHAHMDGQGLIEKAGLTADLNTFYQGTSLPGPVVEHTAL